MKHCLNFWLSRRLSSLRQQPILGFFGESEQHCHNDRHGCSSVRGSWRYGGVGGKHRSRFRAKALADKALKKALVI